MSYKKIKNFNNFKNEAKNNNLPEGDPAYKLGIGRKFRKELEDNEIGSVGRDKNGNLIGGCYVCKVNGILVYDHIRSGEHKRNLAQSKEKKENYVYSLIKESLINESLIKYTGKFKKLLTEIDSPIAKELLNLEDKDIDTRSNYFGLTDKNDVISFISDKKFQSTPKNEKYKVTLEDKFLTYSKVNSKIFIALGFDKLPIYEVGTDEAYCPSIGEVGTIKGEFTNPTSGRIYCWFETEDGDNCVINKMALKPVAGEESEILKNAQEIKIGRGIRALLTSAGINKSDKDIETFVNLFKSQYDILNDAFRFFGIVDKEDIIFYYDEKQYKNDRGQLGSSCMSSDECGDFFSIYVKNPDKVKLVVMYADNDGNIDTSFIRGRALLWTLDNGKMFMDRIYTNYDSDINLFKEFARKNKFYKALQQQGNNGLISPVSGDEVRDNKLCVTLKNFKFECYPYLDTLKYLNVEKGILSNGGFGEGRGFILEDTSGGFDCLTCNGDKEIECLKCDGSGNIECKECDGSREIECVDCKGTGEVNCSVCKGRGSTRGKECEECGGSGKVSCKKCHGNGDVDCPKCRGNGLTDCEECGGSGNVNCPDCGGRRN